VTIYRFTVSCIDQRDGLCLHLYTAAYLEFQDFGKFNSLKNTLTDSRSNMSLSLCLLFTLMSSTGRSQLYTELSSHVSVPYLVRFNIYVYTIII